MNKKIESKPIILDWIAFFAMLTAMLIICSAIILPEVVPDWKKAAYVAMGLGMAIFGMSSCWIGRNTMRLYLIIGLIYFTTATIYLLAYAIWYL